MRALVVLAALLLAISGCGGDEEAPPGTEQTPSLTPTGSDDTSTGAPSDNPTTEPSPQLRPAEVRAARKAFQTWLGAFAGGDADRACSLQTKGFTKQQIERLVKRDQIDPSASCGDLVAVSSILFEALQLDVGGAEITRSPSPDDRASFAVTFKGFPALVYSLVQNDKGWRVDEDLTS